MRKLWLDDLRWSMVLLVAAYHVCYLFNGAGIFGGIPGAPSIPFFDALAGLVYPWSMVLLFTAAGMSARYSLEGRSPRQFLRERTDKLLVPSTLGLFALHWVTGYLNLKLGGALGAIPAPLVYPLSVLSGCGPLWFLHLLYLYDLLLLLFRRLDPAERLYQLGGRSPLLLPLMAVPLWLASKVPAPPLITVYRFGIYGAAFFAGYCVLSHQGQLLLLKRYCWPLAGAGAAFGAVYFLRWNGSNFTADPCLQSWQTDLYLWSTVLALLGLFQRYGGRSAPLCRRMTAMSFGIYVLHYPCLLWICYLLTRCFALPAWANYLLALVLGGALTLTLYALVRRVPVLRYLVLGISGKGSRRA